MRKVNKNLEKLLGIVRMDGPKSASDVFLTIEDGGDWDEEIDQGANQFLRLISKDTKYVRTPNCSSPGDLGVPGELISKLMVAKRNGGTIEGWRKYRENEIYKFNEANLKYAPLARSNIEKWDARYEQIFDVSSGQYSHACLVYRPEVLIRELRSFPDTQSFVILAYKNEWSSLLDRAFGYEDIEEVISYRTLKNGQQRAFSRHYFCGGHLKYSYLPMFNYPSDREILEFVTQLKHYG